MFEEELDLDDPAVQAAIDARIVTELRAIRADLRTERSIRLTLTRVVGAMAVVLVALVALAWSEFVTRNELRRQGDALALVVAQNSKTIDANDYRTCLSGNEFRVEFKDLVLEITDGFVTNPEVNASVHAALSDPKSNFAARDCSTLPH